MPIARDMRNDRRRRVLRENVAQEPPAKTRSRSRNATSVGANNATRRSAGYSQDVRRACSQRLVQLIPVRQTSFAAVVLASLLIPALISAAHYMVYVNGWLPWYGHPLATILDANHDRSLASWFTGQLWLMCLGATILTFQLRRHKLDDYSGEYRLWFWLVCTCIIGSIEASTGIIYLFSLALDNWSMNQLGWSGPAVVKATLAVLIGMLGLRLCTELKTTPSSVVFILCGLVSWAVSATLAQPEFQIDIAPQTRIWARSSLWVGGLTCIWLAALANLRHVYIEAQQRFLSRSRALRKAESVPLKERLKSAMPSLPTRERADGEPSRFRLPAYFRRSSDDAETTSGKQPRNKKTRSKQATRSSNKPEAESQTTRKNSTTSQDIQNQRSGTPASSQTVASQKTDSSAAEPTSNDAGSKRKLGLGGMFKRKPKESSAAAQQSSSTQQPNRSSGGADKSKPESTTTKQSTDVNKKPGRLSGWLGKRKQDEDTSVANSESSKQKTNLRSNVNKGSQPTDDQPEESSKKGRLAGWLRKPKNSDDADEFKKVARDKSVSNKKHTAQSADKKEDDADSETPKRWLPKMKTPTIKKPGWLKMPSIRLKPPTDSEEQNSAEQDSASKTNKGSLPSTAPAGGNAKANSSQSSDDQSQSGARPMTKAERKRLRRMQQQNKAA